MNNKNKTKRIIITIILISIGIIIGLVFMLVGAILSGNVVGFGIHLSIFTLLVLNTVTLIIIYKLFIDNKNNE